VHPAAENDPPLGVQTIFKQGLGMEIDCINRSD